MKKVKVRKEFILEAHKAACIDWKQRIEKELPELFESEFKVGDWVVFIDGDAPQIIIGFDKYNDYRTQRINGSKTVWFKYDAERKATKEEIERHLIEEAERRGFKKGVLFHAIREDTLKKSVLPYKYDPLDLKYWHKEDVLCAGGNLYVKGQWAEIIPTMTKEEAEKKLGYKIV